MENNERKQKTLEALFYLTLILGIIVALVGMPLRYVPDMELVSASFYGIALALFVLTALIAFLRKERFLGVAFLLLGIGWAVVMVLLFN